MKKEVSTRLSGRPFVRDAARMLEHGPFQVLQRLAFVGLAERLSVRVEEGEHDVERMFRLGERGRGLFADLEDGAAVADAVGHGGRVLDGRHGG